MPRPTSKNSDSWAALIREHLQTGDGSGKPEGEGWKTIVEFAKERGIKRSHASVILRELFVDDLLERQRCLIDGIWTLFYRPK